MITRSLVRFITLCLPALAAAMLSASASAQDFSAFVSRVRAMPDPETRTAAVDSFLARVPSFPFCENDTTVHILYFGEAKAVSVAGDVNSWSGTASPMQHLASTGLWYHTLHCEADARLEYKLVVDGVWMLDPRNPHTMSGGFGPNSEFRMPRYVEPPELGSDPAIPHGTLHDTTMACAVLGNRRTVRVYTPAGYDTSMRYPMVLFHDGSDYITFARADTILDWLIARNVIPPVIAVFVPPVDRTSEYAGSQMAPFSDWLVQEVLPAVDARYRTRTEPSQRATIGASNGGSIALYLGVTHPETFGNIGAQSSNVTKVVADAFAGPRKFPIRVYLDLGEYDIDVLIPMVRALVPVLQTKGYDLSYHEYHEGHSWGTWRARLRNALSFFFPMTATLAPPPSRPR